PLGKIINSVNKVSYNRLLLDCPVGNSTVMYNVSKMGKFEVPNIRKRNDDALWLKMLKVEPYIYGMPDVLMQYRIRKNSISSNKVDLIKYHWKLYRDIEHLSIFRSVFHVLAWGIIKVLKIK
ncbi:TPA: glycosyltransferase family 2 protein, partial [Streptococcus suis]